MSKNTIQTNKNFFNSVSEFYDEMIVFDKSLITRQNALKKLIKPGMKTAADIGCGTGLDSISLSLLGLKVTSFDISEEMIQHAKSNSIRRNLEIEYVNQSADKIGKQFNTSFDIALSLGNTLLNLDKNKLIEALNRIYNILKPGGLFLLQVLNFDLIKKENKRILKITQTEENYIVRFYDIFEDFYNFNILRFNTLNPAQFSLNSTKLFPHRISFFKSALKNTGFKKIEIYGDLNLNQFNKFGSNDLVISAVK